MTMQAIVIDRYGGPEVMQLRRVDKPVPGDDQVLVKVAATALNAADWHLMMATPFLVRLQFGMTRPRVNILGADVAGRVEAVGANVTRFRPGDAVFGDLAGGGQWNLGGFAEYALAAEGQLALMPANLSFVEAAAVPLSATTALQGLRDAGRLHPGMKVLINGASGGVGTFAVQIARALGAEVTAVCSTGKMDQALALGAHHVIDYTREDFTRNGQQYDLILAANGDRSLGDYDRALAPGGAYVMAGGSGSQMAGAILAGPLKSRGGKTFKALSAKTTAADLADLRRMIEAGQLRPVIDRCYPLSETVEAMRYLIDGHARGKIVIVVDPDATARPEAARP